ncbi:hypothetical protein BJF87_22345 [Gordonia sp. CNJ-863]|uniref:hypothetical protein n=1 Tax=Gordonia sp. CNJ-863 TaxID=1904963 RepID=UPI0009629DCF|nr:hypothetical protein [Gordonia sp. CNJ-863]OLT46663.1 hypothetical protein BJF87_22345 [Gordonia sp. CNJ-863]
MSSTRTAYTGHGVIDLEAGPVDAAAIKTAGLVAEKFYDSLEQSRIDAELADRILEDDPDRNRAARDRDRAFPRDTSEVDDERKRRHLPDRGEFRTDLSSRQRKDRSVAKRRVHETAPHSQMHEMRWAISDPQRWQHLNASLREATGNAQHLRERDRRSVQRIDRLIQSYERDSGRGHVVYAVVELPTDTPVSRRREVPDTLQPGARISFDQYTMATHTLHEAAAVAATRRAEGSTATSVILEIETSRGMYLGRSDSVNDTSHILPRGLGLRVAGIDEHADYARPGGHDSALVVQLRETPRDPAYQPPVTGRRVFRDRRADAAARAAARDTKEP